jgi:2-polyprenyl-6-methoxyphenol hydroxylase-like FAD-dependent oxidoreductase
MLLARHGYRVLLVDRATFPSDTVSTHFIWPPGATCLDRWGLLERVLATNCPVIRTIGLDLGELQLIGDPPPFNGVREMCAAPDVAEQGPARCRGRGRRGKSERASR